MSQYRKVFFSENDEYRRMIERWEIIRNIENSCVKQYVLPPEFGTGRALSNRNKKYVEMAIFYNYMINTVYGLVGTALRVDPVIELPVGMEYLRENCTGNGLSIKQLIRWVLSEVIKRGRCLLRADYPAVPLDLDGSQTKSLRPLIYPHSAEYVPDWGIDPRSGIDKLNMSLIYDPMTIRKRLVKDTYEQFRLYYLDDNEECVYEILDKEGNSRTEPRLIMQNGSAINSLPVFYIGSEDNDPSVDSPPMWPIAEVNIGHLRNSANYEANLDKHGTGTLFVSPGDNMNTSQWNEMYKGRPIVLGSGEAYNIGRGGTAALLQLGANQEAATAMRDKEEKIIAMGGDIIRPGSASQPVATALIANAAKYSKLATYMRNTEYGVEQLIKECCKYEGIDDSEVKVSLCYDYLPETQDPAMLDSIARSWQMGALPQSIIFDYGRRTGLIADDKTDEELKKEIEDEGEEGTQMIPPVANNLPLLPNAQELNSLEENADE